MSVISWYKRLFSSADAPAEMNVSALSSSNGCVKCATNKAGKRSCCARGGAWFKNCGDAGDPQFDHSWTEGIQACKSFESSVLVRAQTEDVFRHVEGILYPLNTGQSRNDTRQQTQVYHTGTVSTAGHTDAKDCAGLEIFVISTCFLFIIAHFAAEVSLLLQFC